MPTPLRVLILEDEPTDAELMVRELRRAGFDPTWQRVEAESDYLAHLDPALDVILADYKLPQFDAVRALRLLQERGLELPFIVVSGAISEEVAVECMKQGAADYLLKDRLARLDPAVAQALEQHRLGGERKRAEAALRLSEEHFRRTFDESPIGAAIVSLDYRFQRVNAAFCQITGYSEDELVSHPFADITHPDDLAAEQRLLAGEIEQYQTDKRYIRKDGEIVWIHLSVRMMRDAAGWPLYFLPMMEDITARKRAEKTQYRYTRRLEALHEIDGSILAARSPEKIAQAALRHIRQLVPCQGASLVLFDAEADEARVLAAHGNDKTSLRGGAHFPLQAFGIPEELRQGKVYIVEDSQSFSQPIPIMQGLKVEGLRSYIIVPLVSQGNLIGSLNLVADSPRAFASEHVDIAREIADHLAIAIQQARLNEQVQRHAAELEQKVEQRTEELNAANVLLEEASRHKSQFLANMSHELRTPLSSILGFSQLLREQAYGFLTAKQASYVDNIHRSGQHLLALINDLLDLSKVEAGKIELRPEAFGLHGALAAALSEIRPQAEAKHLKLQLQVDNALATLTADPVRFKQILFNLLSNAVKFTADGGRVTVTARIGSRGEGLGFSEGSRPDPKPYPLDPGEFVEIAVQDTGIGIKAEDLPKLFQPFTQLESPFEKQHQGTGLGLALTKRLVELHGGTIRAESAGKGRGSTFTVFLPLGPQDGAREEAVTLKENLVAADRGLHQWPGLRNLVAYRKSQGAGGQRPVPSCGPGR